MATAAEAAAVKELAGEGKKAKVMFDGAEREVNVTQRQVKGLFRDVLEEVRHVEPDDGDEADGIEAQPGPEVDLAGARRPARPARRAGALGAQPFAGERPDQGRHPAVEPPVPAPHRGPGIVRLPLVALPLWNRDHA